MSIAGHVAIDPARCWSRRYGPCQATEPLLRFRRELVKRVVSKDQPDLTWGFILPQPFLGYVLPVYQEIPL